MGLGHSEGFEDLVFVSADTGPNPKRFRVQGLGKTLNPLAFAGSVG